jgi:hypothetical protein
MADFLNIARLTAAPAAGALIGAFAGYFLVYKGEQQVCEFLNAHGMYMFPILGALVGIAGGYMVQHGIPVLQVTS